jgi:hypothetical protein
MATRRKHRRVRAEHRWRRIVNDWRQSGQTASEFGADHGVHKGTLYFWSCRLKKMDGTKATPDEAVMPCFVPVEVADNGLVRPQELHESPAIEVTLSQGDKICVPQGADLLQFSQIVAVLRGDWP